MISEFQQSIQEYLGFDRYDAQHIVKYFEPEIIRKGDYFLKSGHYCNRLSYIVSGYLRIYTSQNDKPVTQWISYPNSFVTELSSLVFNQTSRFNIQALTDCEIYSLPKTVYDQMDQYVKSWHKLEKLFIAKCFLMLENRVLSHLSLSAEERYLMLYKQNKDLFNQVPLQYLASMLGMSPETFSRIRSKTLE